MVGGSSRVLLLGSVPSKIELPDTRLLDAL
jgi:hypothetical protein